MAMGWLATMALFLLMFPLSGAVDIRRLRQMAARGNLTCILVFGDSSVDPGNNNRLTTPMKANFKPYGADLYGGHPTGRFSNGKLATDFVAEALGYKNTISAFLDTNKKSIDLLHGISFASAAAGYDDFTSNLSNVLTVSKQLEYLKHYKLELGRMVGREKAAEIVRGAAYIVSMGTNDFLQNYYLEPQRPKQYTLEQYVDFLVSCMVKDIEEMHKIGARRVVLVGVPPLGCMPIVRTLNGATGCVDSYNHAALSFNIKAKQKLLELRKPLRMKTAFVDAYALIQNAVNNPKKYGFTETAKGCCGSGLVEFASSCRDVTTCPDPSQYVFWDAVHPSEKMYRIIAGEVLASFNLDILL